MELLLERMPRPIGEQLEETEEGEIRTPAFRFNGQELNLNYPKASNVVVRIYDHAGKININRIPRRNMQLLIEKRLGVKMPTLLKFKTYSPRGQIGLI